jgi:hypothetical protein
MSLRKATERLVGLPDAAKWLQIADAHIQSYNKLKSRFILPAEHELIRPIIEAFANDTSAFAKYIKALRDGAQGMPFSELNALYRVVSLRALQVERRTRLRKAVLALTPDLEKHLKREVDYNEQQAVGRAVEQIWGAMRLDALSNARDALGVKRLTSDMRAQVCDEFWAELDKKLAKGIVDLGERTFHDIVVLIE